MVRERRDRRNKRSILLGIESYTQFGILQRVVIHNDLVALKEAVMANIEEVQAAVARIEGNTANVARALGILNDTNAALVQQVADLQAQIEAGNAVTPEQLQELADRLSAADAAMDAIAPEAPNAPNEPEPPSE